MRIIKYLTCIFVTLVIIAGLGIPIVPHPQSILEFPIIPGLEEKARNLFFHVPVAWVSVLGFLLAFYYAIKYLKTKNIDYDLKSSSSAGLGMLFCSLATITGSIWAKFNWGSFWNWDPRETSIVILLMIYGSYFALRTAISSYEIRARLSAVYAILAGLTVPFLVFILPRVTAGLHPGAKGDASGSTPLAQLRMPPNMKIIFFIGLLSFSLLFIWLLQVRVRLARLEHQLYMKQL